MDLVEVKALNIDSGNNISNYNNLKIPTLDEYLNCCVENKSKLPSIDITAIKYIIDTNTPKITAGPPNFGIAFVCILLLSFGTSTAPILLAIFLVYGVATNDTINANKKAIAIFPHI